MEETKMVRPKKVRKPPVKKPETVQDNPQQVEPENKYAARMKVRGTSAPRITGPEGDKVTRVGLGNLTVEDNGQRPYL